MIENAIKKGLPRFSRKIRMCLMGFGHKVKCLSRSPLIRVKLVAWTNSNRLKAQNKLKTQVLPSDRGIYSPQCIRLRRTRLGALYLSAVNYYFDLILSYDCLVEAFFVELETKWISHKIMLHDKKPKSDSNLVKIAI